jgi:hypothetical protein
MDHLSYDGTTQRGSFAAGIDISEPDIDETDRSGTQMLDNGRVYNQAIASELGTMHAWGLWHGDDVTARFSRDGTLKAKNMVDIDQLKAAVAAATDFADLKTEIAALVAYTP